MNHRSCNLLALLCTLLVSMQASGVHLHYCLDGFGQPAALHAADLPSHHDHHGHSPEQSAEDAHSDLIIFLGRDAVVKKSGLLDHLDDHALPPSPFLALTEAVFEAPIIDHVGVAAVHSQALPPPARGPPQFISR